ncbi:MAG: lysophospholipase [Aridibacter famidurans]|nr:lysophospholipase [Aridibacter famidurans]
MKESSFEGVGGLKIATRSWQPKGRPRAVMVLVHGFNAHSGYMVWPAEQFTANGFASYALDLRGRGRSEGERFYVEELSEYLADVDGLVEIARAENPGLPVYVIGHSAGGVVSCNYVLENQDKVAGLICHSFAFDVGIPNVAALLIKGLGHITPHLHIFALKNADFSRDPKAVEAMNNDPLIKDESQPAETGRVLLNASQNFRERMADFKVPVMIIHGTADKATLPRGSEYFYEHAGSDDKTLNLYEGHFHDLLNDVDREVVMADILEWLDARVPREEAAAA